MICNDLIMSWCPSIRCSQRFCTLLSGALPSCALSCGETLNCPVLLCVTHVSRPLTGSERTYGGNLSGLSFMWPLHILVTII